MPCDAICHPSVGTGAAISQWWVKSPALGSFAEPVAAASLGQVYKATLAETGEVVAVKVQRPGIGESIAIDMLLLRRLLELVDRSQDILAQPLVPLLDEFAAKLFGELDYVAEGTTIVRTVQPAFRF